MKLHIPVQLICISFILSFVSNLSYADTIFSDDFESGDMLSTNQDGFSWGKNNGTSIVTTKPLCGGLPLGDPTAIYNNKVICNGPQTPAGDGDWNAKNGDNSLRFRYAANRNWTEQRFDLGIGYSEVWISYWIKVPANFSRGLTGGAANNKWFKFWMGDFSLYDQAGVSQFNTQDWAGKPATNIDVVLAYDNADGVGGYSSRYVDYITPADSGRWMHIVYHMKASSGAGAKDGEISWYRKWENASSYETIADLNNIEIPIGAKSIANGYSGWSSGYLMGWANRPYTEDTEWLVDDFMVSTTSPLLPDQPRPKPPILY